METDLIGQSVEVYVYDNGNETKQFGKIRATTYDRTDCRFIFAIQLGSGKFVTRHAEDVKVSRA